MEEVILSVVGLELLAIVYLAIAISALRAQIAELRGRLLRHENGSA